MARSVGSNKSRRHRTKLMAKWRKARMRKAKRLAQRRPGGRLKAVGLHARRRAIAPK